MIAGSAWVTSAQAPAPPATQGNCELDLSATSEYAAMLRDGRDGFERSVAALTAKLKAAERDRDQFKAKAAALEAALEAARKAVPVPSAPGKTEGP